MSRKEQLHVELGEPVDARLEEGPAPARQIRPSEALAEDDVAREERLGFGPVKTNAPGAWPGV